MKGREYCEPTYLLDCISSNGFQVLSHQVVRANTFRLTRDGELNLLIRWMVPLEGEAEMDVREDYKHTISTSQALFSMYSRTESVAELGFHLPAVQRPIGAPANGKTINRR